MQQSPPEVIPLFLPILLPLLNGRLQVVDVKN